MSRCHRYNVGDRWPVGGVPVSARLVALGRVKPGESRRVRYAITDELWAPEPSGDVPEVDPSDWRKQQVEDELAWGGEL